MVDLELNPLLDVLRIYQCPRLCDVLMVTPKLTKVQVLDCPTLATLYLLQSQQEPNIPFLSSQLHLSELKQVEICNSPSLEGISLDAPKLNTLQVKDCTLLFAVSASLHPLSCPQELELASLSCLASLEDLVTSPGVEDAAVSDGGAWLSHLTALQVLRIEKCEQLRCLAKLGPLPPYLRDLSILKCQKLEALLEKGIIFTSACIKRLTLRGCLKLKLIPYQSHDLTTH